MYLRKNCYTVISSMPSFYGTNYWCDQCNKLYDHRESHRCSIKCLCCYGFDCFDDPHLLNSAITVFVISVALFVSTFIRKNMSAMVQRPFAIAFSVARIAANMFPIEPNINASISSAKFVEKKFSKKVKHLKLYLILLILLLLVYCRSPMFYATVVWRSC